MSLGAWAMTVACSAAPPPPAEAPAPAEAAPPAATSAAAAAPEAPSAEPPPAPPPEPVDPAPTEAADASNVAEEVASACAELCKQASEKCSTRSARKCRANCERYEGLAERCSAEVLAAVRCQGQSPGLVCSNVVGQCSGEFQKLNACESGEQPKAEAPTAPSPLPAGWVMIEDEEAGFSVGLPSAPASGLESGNRTWRATDAEGVSYVVAVMPPFEGVVDDKTLVRKVLVILGQQCQRDMKIHGRFQKDGREAARFDSNCRSGEAWHGMLRISERNVIMTAEIVPPGKSPAGESYYYSFRYLDRP